MFKVKLRNGETFDFDKKCNMVDYSSSDKFALFKHLREDKSYYILAMVPYDLITYVTSEKEYRKPFNKSNGARNEGADR